MVVPHPLRSPQLTSHAGSGWLAMLCCLRCLSPCRYDPTDFEDDDDDDDDDDIPDLRLKALVDLPRGGIKHGQRVVVSDDSQDSKVSSWLF